MEKELTEIYLKTKKGYPVDQYIERIKSSIDRDDVEGVIMPFDEGISVIVADMRKCELSLEDYKKFITEKINKEFSNEILEIDFIFECEDDNFEIEK